MARPPKLPEEEIKEALKDVPQWERKDDSIVREIGVENFAKAIGVVNAIGILAEKAGHHPDLLIYGWNKVRATLSTHDQGGLTENDFKLAKQIDELNF